MAYATPADLLKRIDSRVIGDLVGDVNLRVDATALLTDPNVLAALDDATGTINSAALVAGRYTVTELEDMTGTDAAFLIRITCNLAYGMLVQRRGLPTEQIEQYHEALSLLSYLRNGERIFAIAENIVDGNPQASFPSGTVYSNLQLMRDLSKTFPVRRDQKVSYGPNTGSI